MTDAIVVCGLSKRFGQTQALDKLELSVATGEVHGFLGPNGAGKSTALRVLLGLLRADSGELSVLGADPWRDATELHRRLAYVPGDVSLWPNLTGGEVIDLLSRLRGSVDLQRQKRYLNDFALDPKKYCRTYSKGNRQKVALVAALACNVELLLLDEPTSGLDPLMEQVFRDCIREERARGRTVLLSSHILSEVEQLCDRVTILRAGRAIETGSLLELSALNRSTIHATLRTAPTLASLQSIGGVQNIKIDGLSVSLQVETSALDALLRELSTLGVQSLVSKPASLEEIFLQHYRTQESSPVGPTT